MGDLVDVHTHAVLSLMGGIALDMGFAPAYTRGVPHGHDITEDEAVAHARLGALESMTFGSTTMVNSYVRARGPRRWTKQDQTALRSAAEQEG